MKSVEWKTYRTRFLVKAKQLNSALSFIDHLGRRHCGHKGDYLVESSEGVLSIAPRQIFEDIYVSMPRARKRTAEPAGPHYRTEAQPGREFEFHPLPVEALDIENITNGTAHYPLADSRQDQPGAVLRPRRKSPQPVHAPAPRIGLM